MVLTAPSIQGVVEFDLAPSGHLALVTILVVTGVMVAVIVVCYLLGYWVFGPLSYGFRPFVSPKKAALDPEKYRRR